MGKGEGERGDGVRYVTEKVQLLCTLKSSSTQADRLRKHGGPMHREAG
jgi:hypothetical protein